MLYQGNASAEVRARLSPTSTVVIFMPPLDELKRLAKTTDRELLKQLVLYHIVPLAEVGPAMLRAARESKLSVPLTTLSGWSLQFDSADRSPDADLRGRVQFADFVGNINGVDLMVEVQPEGFGESVGVQRIRRVLQPAPSLAIEPAPAASSASSSSSSSSSTAATVETSPKAVGHTDEERRAHMEKYEKLRTRGATPDDIARFNRESKEAKEKEHTTRNGEKPLVIAEKTPGQVLVPGGPTFAQAQETALRELKYAKSLKEAQDALERLEDARKRSDPAALRSEFSPQAHNEQSLLRQQALAANIELSLQDKFQLRDELNKFQIRVKAE
jgi:hypothetical protein